MGQRISGEATWRRSRIVTAVASPAAGADWSVPVPSGHLWSLVSVFAQLVTSGVAGNRAPRFFVSDGIATWFLIPPAAVQGLTLTVTYCWHPFATPLLVGGASAIAIPPLDLEPGWSFGVSTALLDVGDQWSGIRASLVDTTIRGSGVDLASIPLTVVELVTSSPD